MAAPTQTRRILIKVDTSDSRALQDVADKLGVLNQRTKSMSDNMRFLTNAFRGWLGYLGVRELANLSDQMQNLENRLKIVTTDGRDSAAVLESIREIAKSTYQPISNVAEAYVRMGSALKNVKADSQQLAALTETLINTFRVAGTTTTETSNTMIQLSQAFSSGEVRGQELRSVIEQNATLAGYLRKEFGKDIFKKAADGMITASTITKVLIDNFDELQKQAKELTPTFEQSLNNAMTDFQVSVHGVNKELGISIGFFKTITAIVNNVGAIFAGLATGAITFLVVKLGGLTAALGALWKVISGLFIGSNPLGWAIGAAVAVGTLVYSLGGLENTLLYVKIGTYEVINAFLEWGIVAAKFANNTKLANERAEDLVINQAKISAWYEDIARNNMKNSVTDEEKRNAAMKEQLKSFLELQKAYEGATPKVKKVKEILGELNKEFLNTKDVEAYNAKLVNFEIYKVNREFEEGKFNVFEFNKRLNELKTEDLSRDLRAGMISIQQFNAQVTGFKIDELTMKFKAGKISLVEYNTELAKISEQFLPGSALISGTNKYIESVGTISDQIANGVTNTFGALEEYMTEFTQKGSADFKKFAQGVLDDINKIIVRSLIIRPLAQGILNSFSPSTAGNAAGQSYTDYSGYAAKGMAFDGGVRKFAKGGIVDSPTAFQYGGGKRGLMGEAGTEAIIPLRRAGNGDLGVQASLTPVSINIINQTGAAVEQSESTGPNGEKNIDIFIVNKMKDGIASGRLDKAMANAYGVKRKGS